METNQETKPDASQLCSDFNAAYPIGTLVEYWRGPRRGQATGTVTTRSVAWPMCEKASILLTGVLGAIPLTHVNVISTPAPAFQAVDDE